MAGKTYDFPFGIEWVAEICGLLTEKHTRQGGEINVRCPAEDCKDRNNHLGINIAKDQWCCVRCGRSGGMIQLYMLVHGCSKKYATAMLYKIWNGTPPTKIPARKEIEIPSETVAPIERRDAAYTALLNSCDLSEEHCDSLLARGLTMENIECYGYKTLPQRTIAVESHTPNTTDVAGYYTYHGKRYCNTSIPGILIPFRDLHGRIGCMQIRTFDRKSKYVSFSSGKPENGRQDCTKAVTLVHHVGIDPQNPPEIVFITEGALKADVAHALSGKPFIAIAGVQNQSKLKDALLLLKSIGVREIRFAFDNDMYTKEAVMRGVRSCATLVRATGLKISQLKWDQNDKGIDDYLWSRHQLRING